MSLKLEAAPLAHTLDQLLSCLSLSWSSSKAESPLTVDTFSLASHSLAHWLAPNPRFLWLLFLWDWVWSLQAASSPSLIGISLVCQPIFLSYWPFVLRSSSHLPSKTSCFALTCPGPLRSPLPSHLPGKLSSLSSPLRCHLGLRPPRQWEPFSFRPHHAFSLYGTSAFTAASRRRCWAHQLQTPPLAQPPEHLLNRPRNCFLVLIDLS